MSKIAQAPIGAEKYRSPQCIPFHITLESAVLTDSYSASHEQIGGLGDVGGWDPDGLFIL